MRYLWMAILLSFIGVQAHAAAAPEFTLQSADGSAVSLADYRGQYVVLEWFNPDCPFVKKHYESGNMQSLQKMYTGKGVAWLSINSSAPGKQGHYSAKEHKMKMTAKGASQTAILLDPKGSVGRAYDAKTTPHMYIVDPKGEIVYQGAIDSKASANPAHIEGATNYVAQALDEVLAGEEVSESSSKPYGCSVKY